MRVVDPEVTDAQDVLPPDDIRCPQETKTKKINKNGGTVHEGIQHGFEALLHVTKTLQSQLCEKSIFQTEHDTATNPTFVATLCTNGINLFK